MQPWPSWPIETSPAAFTSAALSILAYLDPGTGSYAIQLVLATLFGGLFALKQSWAQWKAWFALRTGGRPTRNDVRADRPATEMRPPNVARPRTHGQQTAEV